MVHTLWTGIGKYNELLSMSCGCEIQLTLDIRGRNNLLSLEGGRELLVKNCSSVTADLMMLWSCMFVWAGLISNFENMKSLVSTKVTNI